MQDPNSSPSLTELLARVRAGDRDAAAEVFDRYRDRLIRRIRRRLRGPVRRLWDSQDIASTVARRLDALVSAQSVRANTEAEALSLITRIAQNAIIDKNRIIDRVQESESQGEQWAITLSEQIRERQAELDVEELFAAIFERVTRPDDREMLSLWLQGLNHAEIARVTGRSHDLVRYHWSRLRQQLSSEFAELAA